MTIKKQWVKIKENWLIIALAFLLIIMLNAGNIQTTSNSLMRTTYDKAVGQYSGEGMIARSYIPESNFAPDTEDRKITKTTSVSTEIRRGDFKKQETKLKSIISSTYSYLINENVNRYGEDWRGYHHGYYQLKVETNKYNAVIDQIKDIGKVQSFCENANDVTDQYTNLELNLELEKERLEKYRQIYTEAKTSEEKLDVSDRIFMQERTVKYLEDRITNIDQRVNYTTITVTMTEKRSGYANVAIVKLSALVKSFIDSFNSLLNVIFSIMPWAIAIMTGFLGWKLFRKRA